MSVRDYQDLLIASSRDYYSSTPLSEKVKKAFYAVPRHKFIPKYRRWGKHWTYVTPENLESNLPVLYADYPLVIFGEDSDFRKPKGTQFISTISQPSFVLRMLDLLRLEEGQKVFELGTGSGWNAALMGKIVGPTGKVISVEIIPELIERAKDSLKSAGIENVEVHYADGGDGWKEEAPFDRAIFTAGSFDLPKSFYKQMKEGGLLLFVLKNKGGGDSLYLLEKKNGYFESIYSMACEFVPLTGKYHVRDMEEVGFEKILFQNGLRNKVVASQKFWWGESYILKTFLAITEDSFTPILLPEGERAFSLMDKDSHSLAVIYPGRIDCYGNETAKNKFIASIQKWLALGMPSVENFHLKVYPKDHLTRPKAQEWLSVRNESVFVWSLKSRKSLEREIVDDFY